MTRTMVGDNNKEGCGMAWNVWNGLMSQRIRTLFREEGGKWYLRQQ